jgi:hypothetical protein
MIQNSHYVGQDPESPTQETSLAVQQWVELVRGERKVAVPANLFRVMEVRTEDIYCLRCCDVRRCDAVYGFVTGQRHLTRFLRWCRVCRKEEFG